MCCSEATAAGEPAREKANFGVLCCRVINGRAFTFSKKRKMNQFFCVLPNNNKNGETRLNGD